MTRKSVVAALLVGTCLGLMTATAHAAPAGGVRTHATSATTARAMRVTAASAPRLRASQGDFAGQGIRIHTASASGAPTVGEGYRGVGLTYYGVAEGEYINDRHSDLWAHIKDNRTGVAGWLSTCYIHVNG
ncbi:hypothetical protein ACIQU6_42290 [Streptomyces sp. NPDC090442]|uniref:hypothetical protein n=1 Tax=Streptomyces sp. NPDC090442 TaxID=3365962 RepID=UPI00381836E5